jgi:localization factor PodJL
VGQKRKPYRARDDDALGDELAAVNERLDELTLHIEHLAQAGLGRRNSTEQNGEVSGDGVAEALARLDRRLDQVVSGGYAAPREPVRRATAAAPAPRPPASNPIPPDWVAQIAARQRELDGEAMPAAHPPRSGCDLTGLEQQLHHITSQIASLQQPYEETFAALRHDMAEAGRTLTEAGPCLAVEALEAQMGSLAERISHSREAGTDGAALTRLEQGLAEVRNAMRGLPQPESLAGFEEAVRGLSHKIDQIGLPGDPAAFKQLEQAVVSLHGAMSNVASEGSLAQLAVEVHGLASGLPHGAAKANGDALSRIEQRIAALSEKLDTTDGRLGHLGAIERGLTDVLAHVEGMRDGGPRQIFGGPVSRALAETAAESPSPALAPALAMAAEMQHHPTPAAPVASPLDLIPNEPPAETAIQVSQSSPLPLSPSRPAVAPAPLGAAAPVAIQPSRPPTANGRPRLEPRRPIDPDLPPDTPIEPGTGVPRVRSNSAAARIAASEALLGGARLMTEEVNIKSAAIAAARNAIKSASLETPAKTPRVAAREPLPRFKWFKKARKAESAPPEAPAPSSKTPEIAPSDGMEQTEASGHRVVKRLKKVLVAASVAIIVVGAAQTALDLLLPRDAPEIAPPTSPDASTSAAPETTQALPVLADEPPSVAPTPPDNPDTTGTIEHSTVVSPAAPKSPADAAGPIARPLTAHTPTVNPSTPASAGSPASPASPVSPETATSVLHTAIAAHDPAAEYEMGSRHAEGRGVSQNLTEAARWLERAANAGFVPAQFRLAGLNEKGEGVKRDVQAARRLYLAAANKGHAKAMHNLAVIHAEGVDGKPDYKVAAQWFRKAAAYGIADSQYNMAILHARGIGVEANLAESYKWFALAAGRGDQDAAKKRDEVAARLDPQTLMAAKLAVQTFVAEREPDEATNLRVPPGGWDRVPAQPAKPRPRAAASPTR